MENKIINLRYKTILKLIKNGIDSDEKIRNIKIDDIFNIKGITTDDIKNINGYIGILSDLIDFDPKYRNIVENQLGQVVVVDNERTLNIIGKLINYKYKVVSLDGEILHVGGSITGGTSKKNTMLNRNDSIIYNFLKS